MSDSIATILGYEARTRVISDFVFQNLRLSQMFDVPALHDNINGKIAKWDVNIADRVAGVYSASGSPAQPINLTTVREDTAVCLRDYRKKDIDSDTLNQLRQEGTDNTFQQMGRQLITKEQRALAQNIAMNKELHILRTLDAGNQTYNLTDGRGNEVTVSLNNNMPAGNDWTVAADWSTAGTDILTDIQTSVELAQQESGMQLTHAWCNSSVKTYFQNNTAIQNLLGGTNEAVRQLQNNDDVKISGITFHFYDGTYKDTAGTITKFVADDFVIFHPDPSPDWCKMVRGTEIIVVNGQMRNNRGLGSWGKMIDDPGGIVLYALENYMFCLEVPGAVINLDLTA